MITEEGNESVSYFVELFLDVNFHIHKVELIEIFSSFQGQEIDDIPLKIWAALETTPDSGSKKVVEGPSVLLSAL